MEPQPNEALLRNELTTELEKNVQTLRTIMQMPENKDAIMREFKVGQVECCLFYMEGMAGSGYINDNILYPCHTFGLPEVPPEQRAEALVKSTLDISDAELEARFSKLTTDLLDGKTILLVDGCAEAIILETRSYEKRNVDKTVSESVIAGAQQGFVENLRTNITLLRRIIRSPMFISEMQSVGRQLPTNISIMFLKGVANEQVLGEVRRRLKLLDVDTVLDSGHLQQLIEERPFMMFSQTLSTERPDRAAKLISEGRIAVMVDNSPYALIVPVSLFDFLQTADDSFMRWQHSTFNRVVRLLGAGMSLLLPSLYVSLTLYHTQMIPLDLLISIAQSRANSPFTVVTEMLFMEFAFYLVNEAGARLPSQIGSALGIVGALILGQAAVAANIICPIVIIIAALTGLGNYAIPDYGLSITVQIMRLGLLLVSSLFGLYGLCLGLFLIICVMCSVQSFGQPYMAPIAPWRPHDMGVVAQSPTWRDNRPLYSTQKNAWLRHTPGGKKTRGWEGDKNET